MTPSRILIVDDEFSFAEYAKMILEKMGYQVITLLEGSRARETAAAEQPALILMDFAMQDTDGIEAIRSLKSDPATKEIPIILCSITKSRSDVQGALDAGAVDFMSKPLNQQDLKQKIQKALGA